MIGYKATDMNGCCRGFKFEVGKTYTKDTPKEELKCCTDKVIHFCRDIFAIEEESSYLLAKSRIFEVIAGDYVREGGKYGTNSLTILREITGEEKEDILNPPERHNTGKHNTGNYNTGNYNIGDYNGGDHNVGDYNDGNCNAGSYNIGYFNTGKGNIGDYNTGGDNAGNCNTGNYNRGGYNTGNYNAGYFNTGDYNTGDYNAGYYNTGSYNTGYFNTDEPCVRMFNKMTDKKIYEISIPSWCDLGKVADLEPTNYKKLWHEVWKSVGVAEHKELLRLPNWDNEVFKEITGIDAEAAIAAEEQYEI